LEELEELLQGRRQFAVQLAAVAGCFWALIKFFIAGVTGLIISN
jgi:hypothetical protein